MTTSPFDKNIKLFMTRGKTIFTNEEIKTIKCLISQLENAESEKQKNIRSKIRKIGLYWQDVGNGSSYTVANFQNLLDTGVIKILNKQSSLSATENKRFDKQPPLNSNDIPKNRIKGRINSDEYYVIDLCDEILGEKAQRQAKFDFLKGDTGRHLPVDAYYKDKNLVIEYYERQHSERVDLFDKKMTASGVTRDKQRQIYDERRKSELPKHGIDIVVINYTDFGTKKKLERNKQKDLVTIRRILKKYLAD